MSLTELVAGARDAGLDAVCVTDHDRFLDPDIAARLSAEYGILVLPGSEVTTEDGHLLVFGLTEYVFGMHNTFFLKGMVERVGGALVAAHPYRRSYRPEAPKGSDRYRQIVQDTGRSPLCRVADAVEVLNGRGSHDENSFSSDLSVDLDMTGVGSSDSHRLEDLGRFATEFQRPVRSLEDLVTELKAGRVRPVELDTRTAPGDNP